jgi:ABC-2 type transport system permease protein
MPVRAFGRLVRFGLGQLLSGRRLLVALVLVWVPLVLPSVAVAASGTGSAAVGLDLIRQLALPVLLPILSLVFATAALGNEVRDGTIVNLVLKPIRRVTVLAAKYLAAVLATCAILLPAEAVALVVAAQRSATPRLAAGILLASVLGAIAYTALGSLLGLVTSRALLIGLAYVLLWEGVVAGAAPSAAALSVRGYTEALLAAIVDPEGLGFSARLGPLAALMGGLLVAAAAMALAARRLNRMDLR